MKHISILVPETAIIEAIADPHYLFNVVNGFLQTAGKQPLFQIHLVGLKKEMKLNGSIYAVHPDKLIKDIEKTDLIIIPAISGDFSEAIEKNKKLLPWIVAQYEKGAEVASLCMGAFLLASTGLLDGKRCSTHWGAANIFRKMFPNVEMVDGSIMTEEGSIYSSGGANSYWKLLLYLVEKYTDRETAIQAAKYFAIDLDRSSQSAFIMFEGQKSHQDHDILKVQDFIEQNYNEKLQVDDLAEKFNMGRRTFERRFKSATHHSVLDYIQRIKIEAAKRKIESNGHQITEVMFEVGYSDTKAFRSVFKKVTGLTPLEYRNKYGKAQHSING